MKKIKLKGTAVKKDLGTGCWGIIDAKGHPWRPVNMPEQLKKEGAEVECVAVKATEDISIFMWGTPIHIISFLTPALKL